MNREELWVYGDFLKARFSSFINHLRGPIQNRGVVLDEEELRQYGMEVHRRWNEFVDNVSEYERKLAEAISRRDDEKTSG